MKESFNFCLVSLMVLGLFTRCNNASGRNDAAASDSVDVHKDWKIGVQLWTFHYVPFVQAIEKADSAHVQYLEAIPGQPLGGDMKDSFDINMSAASRAEVKRLLQSKGMHIVAMGVISTGSIADWKRCFDLAKEFELSYITAEPGKDQWDAVDSLAGIYGINIAIHDHPRPNSYWHPDSVLAAIRGHHHIGSCADVGHWARNGLDPVECLKKLEGQRFKGMFSIEREGNWYNNVPDVTATIKFYNEQLSKL